eukprot:5038754-Pyramimonas_sp.AAC.1
MRINPEFHLPSPSGLGASTRTAEVNSKSRLVDAIRLVDSIRLADPARTRLGESTCALNINST